MKTDNEVRDDVIEELRWDPQLTDPDAIGVAVTDGAVTLTGHVPSFGAKVAAARAAERVNGVKAVADDLHVKLAGSARDDSDIATAIAHIMQWNMQIPQDTVHARVEDGWVRLHGEVEYDHQRREVERMVRNVWGVVGVNDDITIRPRANPGRVQDEITSALEREARIDARHISVQASGHVAKLYGSVHSLHEATAATAAAAAAPGVSMVENHLVVAP